MYNICKSLKQLHIMRKGSLPSTAFIILESNQDQWELLRRGLINEVTCSGVIERGEENKARVKLHITSVLAPGEYKTNPRSSAEHFGHVSEGVSRASVWFMKQYSSKVWFLMGHLKSTPNIPIVILYYEMFDLAVYALKKEADDLSSFLPEGIHLS